MSVGGAWIEFDRFQELCAGCRKIELVVRFLHAESGVRFGQRRIQLDCSGRCGPGLRKAVLRRKKAHNIADVVGVRKTGIGQRKAGISCRGVLEELNAFAQSGWSSLVPVKAALQIKVVCFRTYRAHLRRLDLVLWRNVGLHLHGDRPSDLILDIEQVMQSSNRHSSAPTDESGHSLESTAR